MTREEWQAFLGEGTRTGKIAVVRKDGQPLVTPIWFLLDTVTEEGPDGPVEHDELVLTTHSSGAKARILAREPRVCLAVDDQAPPYAYVQVQGTATLTPFEDDPATALAWTTRLGARYMGAERAEEFGRRNAVEGELLVRIRIDKVNAYDDVAGY